LIEKEVERGEGNLMKRGMQDVFLFHKNLTKPSYGAFPSFPKRLMTMIPLFQKAS
jgi:hypothetical protein